MPALILLNIVFLMIEVDFSVGGYYYYRIQVCLDLRILDESGAGCTVLARTVLCLGVHHAVDNADGCSRMDRRLNCGAQLHKRTHTLTHSLTDSLTDSLAVAFHAAFRCEQLRARIYLWRAHLRFIFCLKEISPKSDIHTAKKESKYIRDLSLS